MIPAFFVVLEKLPLTPNGKVDRRVLLTADYINKRDRTVYIEPRNELEKQLAYIWQNILGIQRIGVKDNFFELGGHSISAVRLLSKIENIFSYKLPLTTFFTVQTIEQLANIISKTSITQESASWSSLVPIQTNGKKPPLFCIHAIWGNILFYRKFASYLEPDQPVYGLQAVGLDGNVAPITSVNEMAANYIQEIRSIQPEGPYYILGFSFGGIVAFEIARQLHTQRQETALLGILDTSAPDITAESSVFGISNLGITKLLIRPLFHLRNILKLDFTDQLIYILERIKWHLMVGNLSFFYRYYLCYIKCSPQELRLMDLNLVNSQAAKSYLPLAFPGKLTLFLCTDKNLSLAEQDLSWGKLTGTVEIEAVPGHHTTMMEEPNVRYLAEKVTLCLAKIYKKDHEHNSPNRTTSP
jgi:thioesterase domain-containing protein/acyl carrier protein